MTQTTDANVGKGATVRVNIDKEGTSGVKKKASFQLHLLSVILVFFCSLSKGQWKLTLEQTLLVVEMRFVSEILRHSVISNAAADEYIAALLMGRVVPDDITHSR